MRRLKHFWPLAFLPLLLACQLTSQLRPNNIDSEIDRDNAIILSGGQPRTLDPALTYGGPDNALGAIFSGLVTLDQQLQVQPDLAAGWQISEDGLVYTFYLHQNAVFHDGRPVTVQDVIFSWERAADPVTGSDTAQTYLGDIAGVQEKLAGTAVAISGLRAIDDHTLEVRLTAPVVYFLEKLAYPVAFVVDAENVTQADWEHHPNGTGPFTLQEWRDDDILILARNEYFYRDPANISHLVYLLGANLPLSLYEQDEIDLVGVGGDTLARAQDPNDPLAADLRQTASLCTSSIGLNNRLAPLDDVRVRQALAYALDRQKLVDIFWEDSGLQAAGALPPGMPGYGGVTQPLPYDPARARQLLAEAGYADPADLGTLTFYTAGYDEVNGLVTAVITLWQETLGITIEPVLLDPYTYNDQLYAGDIGHFFSSGWCADYPDPQNFLDILYHSDSVQNLSGYHSAMVDRLLEQARTERDVPTRLALYAQVEQHLAEDVPVIFLAHGVTAVLVKPRVQNYILTPLGVPQWHLVSVTSKQ
ncbi:MAG: peptide ABC transporter substrate-binding protein [Ardenticatenaceae bacterium]|nr:peptide ABC transporter substrate-binding protein [Anaerolineales bacterium]MCB8922945.1 peptide ABC transporter substrate-binding protein [Ardenticatenaceae bacterium]MCB8990322.1 peptide ABC transporter substrate-binding protein [Ardenticatenaceae bacterium]